MDVTIIKAFLNDHLATRDAVERAALIAEVSVATMYRYKSNPEGMSVGALSRLSHHLGLPLSNGAAWGKVDILGGERRRLRLETAIAGSKGKRLITLAPYTVNDELPEITRKLLKLDYGTRAETLERDILSIRANRAELYKSEAYESWEIWNGRSYSDFVSGHGRFAAIPTKLRKAQIEIFIASSNSKSRHRYFYNEPDLPTFGCYSDPAVGLVRIEDIHLEFQEPSLVTSFEETFNDLLNRCKTKSREEFVEFLTTPCP